MAQVHRFRNMVAISTGSGATVYMTAKDASRLGAAITNVSREIKRGVSFTNSVAGTVSFVPDSEEANA